jgi:hypothetical protein
MNSNLVYVTKSKISNVLKAVDLYRSNIDINNFYKVNLSKILAIPELKLLAVYRDILQDPENLLLDQYVKKEFIDSKRYVFESIYPSYHQNNRCDRLTSAFENYEIPAEIRAGGDATVDEFRKFFKDNLELYNNDYERFVFKASLQFKLQNAPKKIEYINSGIEEVIDATIEGIELHIEKLLKKMESFRTTSDEHIKEIVSFGYATYKAKSRDRDGKLCRKLEQEGSIISQWHDYKNQLKHLLKEYFRAKLNPEFTFNENLLEQLGFRPCAHCCK